MAFNAREVIHWGFNYDMLRADSRAASSTERGKRSAKSLPDKFFFIFYFVPGKGLTPPVKRSPTGRAEILSV